MDRNSIGLARCSRKRSGSPRPTIILRRAEEAVGRPGKRAATDEVETSVGAQGGGSSSLSLPRGGSNHLSGPMWKIDMSSLAEQEREEGLCLSCISARATALQISSLWEMSIALWRQCENEPKLVDTTFFFEDGSNLKLHRCVLSARSKVFQRMFVSSMREAWEGKVFIEDFSFNAFRATMECLYTGSFSHHVLGVDGREVWRLADKYGIDDIKEVLCSLLDEHCLAAAAQFAADQCEDDLFDICLCLAPKYLSRITTHALEGVSASVAQSLMSSLHEGGLAAFLFAQRWCEANITIVPGRDLPKEARALLDCVRLEGVSTQDLARVVRPTGLIPAAQLKALYEERIKVLAFAYPCNLHSFGQRGTGNGRFLIPVAVAVGPDGTIVVSDRDNGRVQLFTRKGDFLRCLGSRGTEDGQLQKPSMNSRGDIICVDSDQNRVVLFDGKTGCYSFSFGGGGRGDGQFDQPCGMAIGPHDEIIVADTRNNSFGSFGAAEGQFNLPTDVSLGQGNTLVVADEFNHRVQVFNHRGDFLFAFGCEGEGPGQFTGPEFVAVTSQGHICVSDWKQHRIHIFTSKGAFVQSVGSQGPASFREPFGLAVCHDDTILVADCLNNRIVVLGCAFDPYTRTPPDSPGVPGPRHIHNSHHWPSHPSNVM